MTAQQLFSKIVLRIAASPPQTINFLDAVNDVLELLGSSLMERSSNLLKSSGSVSYTANVSTANLPAGFWGLIGKPYVSDATIGNTTLEPVENTEDYDHATTNRPATFELTQASGYDVLKVYPTPDASYTVKFEYYKKPSITAMTDSLPFNGLFDSIIADVLVRTGNSGGWVTIMQEFAYIDEAISRIVMSRTPRTLKQPKIKSLWA